jgi:hypothetical protein
MTRRAERRLHRLPAGPLLAAIQAHPAIGWPRRGWTRRLRRYAGKGAAEAYRLAARDGRVSLAAMERLCDAFGWHPRELYGDAYDHAALAGRGPDFDPWRGWHELG